MGADSEYGRRRPCSRDCCLPNSRAQEREAARIDVDAILASLPDELNDVGDDPWGGANLADGGVR